MMTKIFKRLAAPVLAVMVLLQAPLAVSGARAWEDREGNPFTPPAEINRIISMGPSNTEILIALGFTDLIVAADTFSANVDGIDEELPMFSMMSPDGEKIIELEPDIIFITGMSKVEGADLHKAVDESGICVVYIPSSSSIEGIKEDIRFIADVMGVRDRGDEIVAEMEDRIAVISEAAAGITDKKTVYFEISSPPYMISFGKDTFLNEMLEIAGAVNVLGTEEGWLSVADEAILDLNPDIILTSVNYIDDPEDEIMSRPGWDIITAVQNGDVYYIDTDSCNRPSQNIVTALREIAEALYPDIFEQ